MPKAGAYLKCPCCGRAADRGVFTIGALGKVPLQFLELKIVSKGLGLTKTGERAGTFIWSRRLMNREEAEHVFRAVDTAYQVLSQHLEGSLPDMESTEKMLAQIENAELECIGQEWLREAEEELDRRRQLLRNELERRTGEK